MAYEIWEGFKLVFETVKVYVLTSSELAKGIKTVLKGFAWV